MQKNRTTRRTFIAATTGAVLTCGFMPHTGLSAAESKSDRLRMANIGVGPMGSGDALGFNQITDIIAICDLDEKYGLDRLVRNKKFGYHDKEGKRILDTYKDYRRVLDRKDIDLVSIGTPDHWHIKIAIEAMQAGKHVFCQKPLTLTLEENQLVRAAVKKYGKIFQVGTQQRAQKNQFMTASLLVRKGYLGKILKTTCYIGQGRESGIIPKAPVPATLDWNVWQGQAPVHDYIWTNDTKYFSASNAGQGRAHLLFRWWFEYSGGRITDWGAHHIDCALWALNRQTIGTGPVSITPRNVQFLVPYKDGYPTRDDIYNTPLHYNVSCKFDDGSELLIDDDPKENGILFEGTKGRLFVNRGKITGKLIEEGAPKELKEEDYIALNNGKPVEEHKRNMIRCIKEGGTPVSDVASNVEGTNVCHLANLACRFNRTVHWDNKAEKIVNDEQIAALFSRKQRKGFELPKLV